MNKPSIILVVPQMGENISAAAARAMKNFGLSDLRIVVRAVVGPMKRQQVWR